MLLIGKGEITRVVGEKGDTPVCANAKFKKGDVVYRRNLRYMRHLPEGDYIVAVAIPPGFSPDHALADILGEHRPLMARVGARAITYILVRENDTKPYLLRESQIIASGKEPIEIGTIKREAAE